MIRMIPVASTMIRSVGYDEEALKLTVEFMNGTRWTYDDVPESEYSSMMAGGSVGAYFRNNIRNDYDGREV